MKKFMKIAFITFEYPPFIMGGAGIYAANITRQLAKLDHQVIVFTPKIKDLEKEEYHINNLEFRRIKVNKRLPFKALQFWLHLPKIVKEAENDNRFDIIHFNDISYWFLKKRLLKAPNVITVHHLIKDAIRYNRPSLFSRIRDMGGENSFLIPFIQKRCIKYSDRIIAVSNFTNKQIIKTYGVSPEKIDVVYNGISQDGYSFTEKELEEARRNLNLDEIPVLLFVGRVNDKRKGLDILLKAFKITLEKIDATLLIIGGGDQSQARKLAQSLEIYENIVFTGFVDDLTLKKCYVLCDVYVCPSRLEGFGLTILEAMAARKPIIATNVGAIPEILNHGVLVPSENEYALSKAIVKLLNNNENAYGQSTFSRVKEFTWNRAGKNVVKVYRKCLNERKIRI